MSVREQLEKEFLAVKDEKEPETLEQRVARLEGLERTNFVNNGIIGGVLEDALAAVNANSNKVFDFENRILKLEQRTNTQSENTGLVIDCMELLNEKIDASVTPKLSPAERLQKKRYENLMLALCAIIWLCLLAVLLFRHKDAIRYYLKQVFGE